MKKYLFAATLAILLPTGAVYASGIDDLTMQVIQTNDNNEVMNTIEIPDNANAAMPETGHDIDDASHDAQEQTHDAAEEAQEHATEVAHDATEASNEDNEHVVATP